MRWTTPVSLLAMAFVLAVLDARQAQANDPTGVPVVHESFDEIWIVQEGEDLFSRVVFLRNNQVIATRLKTEDMQWNHTHGGFTVGWEDYCHGRIYRVCVAAQFATFTVPKIPPGDQPAWWAMNRNMRDLRRP